MCFGQLIRYISMIACAVCYIYTFSYTATVTNGRSIAAYSTQGAYLITELNEILQWNSGLEEWVFVANLTPAIKQMDCLSNGTKLIGTDGANKVWLWNGVSGGGSSWSKPQGETLFRWVFYDPVTDETHALLNDVDAWKSWDKPTGSAWSDCLPVKSLDDQTRLLVDKNVGGYHQWQDEDMPYLIQLNQSGDGSPFNIYYYGDDSDQALDRITDPPIATHNIDDVFVRQISYDEDQQNLWGLDSSGRPWQWDNTTQQWIARDGRSNGEIEPEEPVEKPSGEEQEGDKINPETSSLLRVQDDWYVRTTYIKGEHRPLVIIFKDTYIMHLVLGEFSKADMNYVDIVIVESNKKKYHGFDNILLRPKETPQKIVRIDGGKRIRENGYLEQLLIANGVVANPGAIGVYPAEHHIIRR